MKRLFTVLLLCTAAAASSCARVSEEPVSSEISSAVSGNPSPEDFVSPVYGALSDNDKALYDKLRDAVVNFEDFVTFDPPVSREDARRIYSLVYTQERKYFWLSNLFYAPDKEITVLRLNYLYEKEDAEVRRAELDLAASTIIGELPDGADDFEKTVFFHDRIVTGCTFSTEEEHVNSAYGVLVKGYGQCEGYAAAMSLLCDKAGIPNYIVCGTNSAGDTHAWNKVMLNGKWYNADCTWDDPIIKQNNPDFVRHDYLLVKDSEIEGKTHFTDPLYSGVPVCDSDELNYFAARGLLFDSPAEGVEAISEQIKSAGLSGRREAEIRFSDEDAYFAAMSRLFDSGEIKEIIEDINGNYGTKIRSAYKHNNDDLHIIHISLIYEYDDE
ncbi:MAG: transglutaminase domain-containing protein [Oscillospiraceae bacterium]